jgi:hypothetical protein
VARDAPAGEQSEERVLIVQTLGVPHPSRRRRPRRRAKPVDPPATPEEVPVTRVTVARSTPFENAEEASAWLDEVARDGKARSAAATDAVELLNRALGALRDAADDPLVQDVGLGGALSIRIGYGTGHELADGNWTEARQLPDPPTPRHLELDPQRQVAQELSGREPEETNEE